MRGAAKLVLLIVAILAAEASVLGAVGAGLLLNAAFRHHHTHMGSMRPFPLIRGPHMRIGHFHCSSIDARQLDAALKDLADAPDSTIVETHEGMKHVVIRKVGSDIRVDVTEPDRDIHVTVPVSFIRIFSTRS
jgi:hypothetical protein